jgi:hypothetical protein
VMATCRHGRRISGDDFKAMTKGFGLTQQGAGLFFGSSARTGQRWAAHGPPPAVAMLLHLMDFEEMAPAELEFILRERASAAPQR